MEFIVGLYCVTNKIKEKETYFWKKSVRQQIDRQKTDKKVYI